MASNEPNPNASTAPAASTNASTLGGKLQHVFTKENLTKLRSAVTRGAVAATRHGVVPIADSYARPPAREQPVPGAEGGTEPPPDTLTEAEKSSLARAANKLVLEMGDLLVATFTPTLSTTPGKLPDRSPDASGFRGEPSLAMAAAAAKGASDAIKAQLAARAEARHEAELKAQAEELRPVSVNVLRMRNRG